MISPVSNAGHAEIRLLPQEKDRSSKFTGRFAATNAAIAEFGTLTLLEALAIIQRKARETGGLDYLQVFEIGGKRLWIIDDGDLVTALLPYEY